MTAQPNRRFAAIANRLWRHGRWLATGPRTTVRQHSLGLPHSQPEDLTPGDYFVQAVLNKYETFHRTDGKTMKAAHGPERGPALE